VGLVLVQALADLEVSLATAAVKFIERHGRRLRLSVHIGE
jgi:hypothetical protein